MCGQLIVPDPNWTWHLDLSLFCTTVHYALSHFKHSQLNALVSSMSLNIDIKDQTQTGNFKILDPNYSVVLLYQSRMKPCVAVQGTWASNIYQWARERESHQLTTNKYNIISFDSNIDGTFGSNQA